MRATCDKPLRTGGVCMLDRGHKGKRHTSVVHGCDACGVTRRGNGPAMTIMDSDGEPDVSFCWFCVNVATK